MGTGMGIRNTQNRHYLCTVNDLKANNVLGASANMDSARDGVD